MAPSLRGSWSTDSNSSPPPSPPPSPKTSNGERDFLDKANARVAPGSVHLYSEEVMYA